MLALYQPWAALLGGEEYEFTTGPGRIFRLGLLFLILITGAKYTANLAAFLVQRARTKFTA